MSEDSGLASSLQHTFSRSNTEFITIAFDVADPGDRGAVASDTLREDVCPRANCL